MWRRAGGRLVALSGRFSTTSPPLVVAPKSQCGAAERALCGIAPSRIMRSSSGKMMDDEDMQLATGFEREELEFKKQGKARFDIDAPGGYFGTEERPALVQSRYDERIVGCAGASGDDEHDVLWFWLRKGKPHTCKICGQYFELEVVGPGGPIGGHH